LTTKNTYKNIKKRDKIETVIFRYRRSQIQYLDWKIFWFLSTIGGKTMKFVASQAIRQKQSLVITAQLQQAIKLLQMNNFELEQFIEEQSLENPFLEVASAETGDKPESLRRKSRRQPPATRMQPISNRAMRRPTAP
jgi:hypothetical protein